MYQFYLIVHWRFLLCLLRKQEQKEAIKLKRQVHFVQGKQNSMKLPQCGLLFIEIFNSGIIYYIPT
jgi:hypothetical protein